jgi:hypothetical protein
VLDEEHWDRPHKIIFICMIMCAISPADASGDFAIVLSMPHRRLKDADR